MAAAFDVQAEPALLGRGGEVALQDGERPVEARAPQLVQQAEGVAAADEDGPEAVELPGPDASLPWLAATCPPWLRHAGQGAAPQVQARPYTTNSPKIRTHPEFGGA